MDTKLKNSRKFAVIVLLLFLAACSSVMMSQYGAIRRTIESQKEAENQSGDTASSMANTLAEGNYLLYNRYVRDTDPAEVLSLYGQQRFDLAEKYLDYELIDGQDEVIASDLSEEELENLNAEDGKKYAFRVKYVFSDSGELEDVQIGGTAFDAAAAYNMESIYINEAASVENYGQISSITNLEDVTILYGMTDENLEAYGKIVASEEGEWYAYYDLSYIGAYRDPLEILSVLLIAAALLMPFIKRLDLSEMKIFRVPFEVAGAGLLFFSFGGFDVMTYVVYHTVKKTFLPAGFEPVISVINFLLWMFLFGMLFWCVTSLRAMFRMKKAYWTERTLTARMLRKMKNKEGENEGKIRKKAGRILTRIKNFFARQYDALLHLDFQDKTNRTILRVVLINFAILFVVCLFWWYGTVALVVYSVLLFMFLKKYTQDLSKKYEVLLKSTNQLAEGRLDIPIEGDVGLFNPIQEELKRIQKGFKKAVDEEVKNERMKTELVTNVSHDLRTPLTAIITYTDLLKNEKDEEKRKEYIHVLERKSLRLKVLIEDLFEISKAASKSVVMHFMKVDIAGLFKQVELENDGKIKEANLEFRTKLPEQKVVMWLDSEKTYRIFENLIVNITKYAMPHTRVYIEMTEQENGVHITMKNVSATELNFNPDEITDRFVRGDSSRNTEGSGLGLAIAKSFAELQHGSLKISTEADLFKADLYLPKLEEPAENSQEGSPENLSMRK
ncbi:sensor histidine kinase [Mediterraneibacter sp.]|uniref:sensor histidine kinase n=1 Tax=Mediterraneibacter sp. TaxID=2316022 RepID=UPI0027B93766|nr:HAMP domain-containing sensor histidine kinase [Mediterraneibacter sp.]